jgi:hypothetical protein
MKPLSAPHFSGTDPQSQNFGENVIFFLSVEWPSLEANITGSVQIFFSIYILIRKVFSQLFNDVYYNSIRIVVFEFEARKKKTMPKILKFSNFVDQNFRYSS